MLLKNSLISEDVTGHSSRPFVDDLYESVLLAASASVDVAEDLDAGAVGAQPGEEGGGQGGGHHPAP